MDELSPFESIESQHTGRTAARAFGAIVVHSYCSSSSSSVRRHVSEVEQARRGGSCGNTRSWAVPTNATSTTLLHQLRDLGKSPRRTVVRIEGLALVAIFLSFFLAAFGSCRRWSNRWFIQKGFLAAHVLSLSLGTYSIGLMQSSSVKSGMYPIWAVSLLTLLGCIDSITAYNGLDYKGPFVKTIFQHCLYCGYVLVISISTTSGVVGNLAIGMLSAITFFKGFHRSLALLVLPTRTREDIDEPAYTEPVVRYDNEQINGKAYISRRDHPLIVAIDYQYSYSPTGMGDDVNSSCVRNDMTLEDVSLGYSMSHLLRRRFLGLETTGQMEKKRGKFRNLVQSRSRTIDYERTLKAVEVELAFLYDVFFTSNEFLHHYEAKTSSFWAFSSFLGICFVAVVAAIPGTILASPSQHLNTSTSPGAGTIIIVDTTTADLVITLALLMALAVLKLVQLLRCWTSNWVRAAFASKHPTSRGGPGSSWWMRLKAFVVTNVNWFDKYLWQDKLGQFSLVTASRRREERGSCGWRYWMCDRLPRMLGRVPYFGQVLEELMFSDIKTGAAIRLHDDVKARVADFMGQIKSSTIGEDWSSLFVDNGLDSSYLPYNNAPLLLGTATMSRAYAFTHRVMMWHIATSYCDEQAEQVKQTKDELRVEEERAAGTGSPGGGGGIERNYRRVAIALSNYCAYLVVSAPELLPGPSVETKRAFDKATALTLSHWPMKSNQMPVAQDSAFSMGVYWGRRLLNEAPPSPECTQLRCSDYWEVLALLWVQTLLYAAPYGDMQRHMQHLSQGGEFITHIWALLYHIGIDKWQSPGAENKEE